MLVSTKSESIRTIRLAESAKKVKTKAKQNKELTKKQMKLRIKHLEKENSKLRARVIELEGILQENGIEVELTSELYGAADEAGGAPSKTKKGGKKYVKPGPKGVMRYDLHTDVQTIATREPRVSISQSPLMLELAAAQKTIQENEEEMKEWRDKHEQSVRECEKLESQLEEKDQMYREAYKAQKLAEDLKDRAEETVSRLQEQLAKLRSVCGCVVVRFI